MTSPGPPPIVLLGPTASGKSALAMALARCFELEIVSVDSAQVYRGLDIGTAKPDAADRARVAHHLLDLREPDQPYSAAAFVADASAAIAAIRARAGPADDGRRVPGRLRWAWPCRCPARGRPVPSRR